MNHDKTWSVKATVISQYIDTYIQLSSNHDNSHCTIYVCSLLMTLFGGVLHHGMCVCVCVCIAAGSVVKYSYNGTEYGLSAKTLLR